MKLVFQIGHIKGFDVFELQVSVEHTIKMFLVKLLFW